MRRTGDALFRPLLPGDADGTAPLPRTVRQLSEGEGLPRPVPFHAIMDIRLCYFYTLMAPQSQLLKCTETAAAGKKGRRSDPPAPVRVRSLLYAGHAAAEGLDVQRHELGLGAGEHLLDHLLDGLGSEDLCTGHIGPQHHHVADLGVAHLVGDLGAGDVVGGQIRAGDLVGDHIAVDEDRAAGGTGAAEAKANLGEDPGAPSPANGSSGIIAFSLLAVIVVLGGFLLLKKKA